MSQTLSTDWIAPIYSAYGRNKAFLEIIRQGDRIRVQPTSLGKTTLNRFWSVWLRELILTKTDHRHSFAVELYRGNVVISSETTIEGLRETVRRLAAEIRPLMHLPLRRVNDRNNPNPKSYGPIEWDIMRPGMPIALIMDAIPLPGNSNLVHLRHWSVDRSEGEFKKFTLNELGSIELWFGGGAMSGRDIAMLVELHFALACST